MQHAVIAGGRQRGMATLLVISVLVFLISLLTIFAARSSLVETRLSANAQRYAQALSVAEYGVDQGMAYMDRQRPVIASTTAPYGWGSLNMWTRCSGTATAIPCGNGSTVVFDNSWIYAGPLPNQVAPSDASLAVQTYAVTQRNATTGLPSPYPLMVIVAVGTADGGEARAVVTRSVVGRGLFVNDVPSPLMVVGNTNLSGTYNVWGNKDGRGPGQVLSTWSASDVSLAGNAKTYDVNDPGSVFPFTESDGAKVLSDKNNEGPDIVDNSPNFPSDLFYYLFGVPRNQAQDIKANAAVYADCSSLGSGSYGLIWITGDCKITSNNIGTTDLPVAIIVEGSVSQSGNSTIHGVLFIMDTSPTVKMSGTITVDGAILVDQNIDLGSGTFNLNYNRAMLSGLNSQFGVFANVEGSWNDAF